MSRRRKRGEVRRAVAATAAAGLGATGVLLLAVAASGAGPAPYTVVVGGSATLTPVTASPSPGETLVFVNAGANPYVLSRTATPFALATTIEPTSSSTPFVVPTGAGSYPYTAQLRQPDNILGQPGSAGPTVAAQVLIARPGSAAPDSSTTSVAPSAVVAPPVASAPQPTRSAPSAAPRRSSAKPRRSGSSASASPSDSATDTAIQPGGLLPEPAQPPLFSDGVPVPLPVLPTADPTLPATASAADQAGGAPSAPVSVDPTPTLPVGPFAADAPRQGPRRSRGLPIALAFAVLLGVAGAVARTLRRTGGLPRRTP